MRIRLDSKRVRLDLTLGRIAPSSRPPQEPPPSQEQEQDPPHEMSYPDVIVTQPLGFRLPDDPLLDGATGQS